MRLGLVWTNKNNLVVFETKQTFVSNTTKLSFQNGSCYDKGHATSSLGFHSFTESNKSYFENVKNKILIMYKMTNRWKMTSFCTHINCNIFLYFDAQKYCMLLQTHPVSEK